VRRGGSFTDHARGKASPPLYAELYRSGLSPLDLSVQAARGKGGGSLSTDEQQVPTAEERHSSVLLEISNTMVRLHKEQFGRGPTSARTYWAGNDTLVCLLENTLTPAERNLVKMGEHQRLRDTRSFFQNASTREFCVPVEQIVGRKIRAFMSAIDTQVDGLVSEIFVLHPEGYDGRSRIERTEF
jgi:uncharacterized protein YbcI